MSVGKFNHIKMNVGSRHHHDSLHLLKFLVCEMAMKKFFHALLLASMAQSGLAFAPCIASGLTMRSSPTLHGMQTSPRGILAAGRGVGGGALPFHLARGAGGRKGVSAASGSMGREFP